MRRKLWGVFVLSVFIVIPAFAQVSCGFVVDLSAPQIDSLYPAPGETVSTTVEFVAYAHDGVKTILPFDRFFPSQNGCVESPRGSGLTRRNHVARHLAISAPQDLGHNPGVSAGPDNEDILIHTHTAPLECFARPLRPAFQILNKRKPYWQEEVGPFPPRPAREKAEPPKRIGVLFTPPA